MSGWLFCGLSSFAVFAPASWRFSAFVFGASFAFLLL